MSFWIRGTKVPATPVAYGGRRPDRDPTNLGSLGPNCPRSWDGQPRDARHNLVVMTNPHSRLGRAHDTPTPTLIMQIAHGFMASKHLFAASELGLFEALGEGPVDLDGLAARTGLTRRAARISADAMVAIGLLHKDADCYANTPEAAAFLSGATPADLRPLLRFWDRFSYPAWADLAGALGRGRPHHQIFDLDEELVPIMSAGIEAATSGACQALPAAAPCGPAAGCWTSVEAPGPGRSRWLPPTPPSRPRSSSWPTSPPSPKATSTRPDSPTGSTSASGTFETVSPQDMTHSCSPTLCTTSPRRPTVRSCDESGRRPAGAQLLLADFWTDPTHTKPLPAALMAGEFAVHLNDGDVYSVEEATAWLSDTGWRLTEHTPLAGPISLVAAKTA